MSTETLTVLSIRQPWASLLLSGEDWCENRSWNTKHRGALWIHASSKIENGECEQYGIDKKRLATGAIIGVVDLIDVIPIDELADRVEGLAEKHGLNRDVGPEFIVGEYCWIVANPRALKTPIPVKGKLNLWRFEANSSDIAELESIPTLITQRPALEVDAEEGEVETHFLVTLDDGSVLELQYFIPEDDDRVHVEFVQRDEVRVIVPEGDPEYVDGPEDYKTACELAWDEYPDQFDQSSDVQ
ncbi:MAG: ASCH domain-containing protein [Planctomycetota bacterium]|nr:ASCH domain-containing protein [Planctomycetota bacterium]